MGKWKIYSIKGDEIAQVSELELHDEWMAECYLTITVKSAEPVSFAIGDYIDYRGERYSINYDPKVLKKARRGTYGEGFIYDNIKFVSDAQSKIVNCDFTDLVLNDNQMHYTGLPTFPFYCETVDDLLDRVQACLEELYPGKFILIGLNTTRNLQRGQIVGRADAFDAAYKKYVDPSGAEKTGTYGKTSVALTADNINCWEALTKINSEFELNFIMRGSVFIAGVDGTFTTSTFRYGKGNGLYEIERISDDDQQVITRLKAYGSEENLPSRYYAELNLQVFAKVEKIDANYATSGLHYAVFLLDLDFAQKYFTERSKSYPGTNERPNYIIRMKANGITVRGYITQDSYIGESKSRCYIYSEYTSKPEEDDRDETDQEAMNAFSEAIKEGDTVYFVSGIEKSSFPLANKNYATENLPNNMAVSRLMLPGFPNQSLYDWVKENGGTDYDDETGKATIDGFTGYFSQDKHRPWIQSLKVADYGIRPGNIYFDGSDNTKDIKPTLEGMQYNGAYVDVIAAAEQITDNGVFGEGDVPNFTLTLPNLGFDLASVYEDGATIDMKDGMCGSRSFQIAAKPSQNESGQWVCKVERVKDDSLDLWFPYNDFQIKAGDHYVLTGIKLPSEYIDAAAKKMFYASIEVLQKNDTTRFTYQPRIDEIWMAKQHDEAIAKDLTSLHDTIHAGDIFLFADEDLGIDEGIIIDVLTIREGSEVPTYEVTLRDEKQVSSIQRMIDKAISGSSVSGGGSGGGSGYTSRQIQSLIENYGGSQFLSRVNNDSAEGLITFLQGFQSVLRAIFGTYNRENPIAGSDEDTGAAILPDGTGDFINLIVRGLVKGTLTIEDLLKSPEIVFTKVLRSEGGAPEMDGTGIHMDATTGTISADGLTIRGWMQVRKLIYNYLEVMQQDLQLGGGGDIEEVVDNGDGTYTLFMHKEAEGKHVPLAVGDILYGKVDDLDAETLGFTYYTSYMRATDVTLRDGKERDEVTVVLWDDVQVPGGKNFPPKPMMTVAHRGNVTDTNRQSFWEFSSTDHCITHYWRVDSPFLRADNYATCYGLMPQILDDAGVLPSTRDKSMPSLYVNTVFYEHIHQIKYPAKIVKEDRGHWVENPTVEVDGETISEPYHYKTYTKETWLKYRNDSSWASLTDEQLHAKMMEEFKVDLEISRVWHYGILWECIVNETTEEPCWGCLDWKAVGGNTIYKGEITTSNGRTFRNGNVDTVLTMRVWYGDEEITSQMVNVSDYAITWKRSTVYNEETGEFEQQSEDLIWTPTITGNNQIKIVRGDMGSGWMITYRQAKISCNVSLTADGQYINMPADYIF